MDNVKSVRNSDFGKDVLKKVTRTQYVLGFVFNDLLDKVLLIKKNKPQWQAGFINGIGGKIEEGESSLLAMCREFSEETGISDSTAYWSRYCTFSVVNSVESNALVDVYTRMLFGDLSYLHHKYTSTGEELLLEEVSSLYKLPVITNLYWLVPMAKESLTESFPFNMGRIDAVVTYIKGNNLS